jgi:predicted MPP superfamily phosphohydrolase
MMKTSADKTQENRNRAVANTISRKQSSGGTFQLVDNRPETVQLQKLQEMMANSPHAKKIAQFQAMADKSTNPYHVQLRKMQGMLANSQLVS